MVYLWEKSSDGLRYPVSFSLARRNITKRRFGLGKQSSKPRCNESWW